MSAELLPPWQTAASRCKADSAYNGSKVGDVPTQPQSLHGQLLVISYSLPGLLPVRIEGSLNRFQWREEGSHALRLRSRQPSRRRVWLSPCTFNPNTPWMMAQARLLPEHAKGQSLPVGVVLRDRDNAYTEPFDVVLGAAGAQGKVLTYHSPNTNAYVERFVQAVQQEGLDKFIAFGTQDLDHLLADIRRLLTPDGFVLLTAHAEDIDAADLGYRLSTVVDHVETGDLGLTATSGARLDLGAFARGDGAS